ncbi:MAG: undecaprenyl-phosphate glucose phosphotransferase [Candidatus Omnitrophota bacterium]
MKIRNDIRLGAILMLGDIVAMNLSFLFSYWLRFNSGFFAIMYGVPGLIEYLKILPILSVVLIFLMRSEKLYSIKARLSIVDEIFTVIKTVTIGMFIFMAGTFLYREFSYSRGMFVIAWSTLILYIGLWRFLVNRIRFALRRRVGKTRNLVMIGDGEMVKRMIDHISDDPHWDYNVKGVVSINGGMSAAADWGVPVIGNLEDLPGIIDSHNIEEIILTETELPRSKILNVIFECEKRMVEFRLVADLLGMVTSQVDMRAIDGVPLLGLKESPLSEGYNRFIKRCIDIVLSAFGLIVLSPVLLVIAALVKVTSPGPIFYMQKRIGEDGRRFAMIKFRTMIQNAEKGVGRVWAKKNDPRRTKIGGLLRKTNIDELPQLVNVIKGEMSLVGPRPERSNFVVKFKEDIPRYMARHKIKSGMTGWAQVNGLRGNTSIEERTKHDLYYIENWSLAFDIKILFMTIIKLFVMENAY